MTTTEAIVLFWGITACHISVMVWTNHQARERQERFEEWVTRLGIVRDEFMDAVRQFNEASK
jgi:hypothetical protein